jgi:hypothetical protein
MINTFIQTGFTNPMKETGLAAAEQEGTAQTHLTGTKIN